MIVGVMEGRNYPLNDSTIGQVPCEGIRTFVGGDHINYLTNKGKKVVHTISPDYWEFTLPQWRNYVTSAIAGNPAYAFEIINEPHPENWVDYWPRFKAASEIIRSKGKRVLMGAIPPVWAQNFYAQAHANQAFPYADGVGLHPYVQNQTALHRFISDRRAQVDGYTEFPKPFYFTEFGCGTGTIDDAQNTTLQGQADYLRQVFTWFKQNATTYNIAWASWFLWRDWTNGNKWVYNAGVRKLDNSPKPSYFELVNVS